MRRTLTPTVVQPSDFAANVAAAEAEVEVETRTPPVNTSASTRTKSHLHRQEQTVYTLAFAWVKTQNWGKI